MLTVQYVDGLRFLADMDEQAVVVGAAPENGGGGTALSAPQLFVMALGACMLEFVVNSCHLRQVQFDRLSLELEYEELELPRCVGEVRATLHIEPELPVDVKRRLVGVARQAALVSTLVRPPEVVIQFAGE